MFTDLLDQPRRELEALRAKCDAQERRIAKLESMMVPCAAQEVRIDSLTKTVAQDRIDFASQLERISKLESMIVATQQQFDAVFEKQKQLELIQSFRVTNGSNSIIDKVPVRDGMVISSYGQLQILHGPFKNGVLIQNYTYDFINCQLVVGCDPIVVFTFIDAGTPKQLLPPNCDGPHEFIVGNPMYVHKTHMSIYIDQFPRGGFSIVCWASDAATYCV